MNLLETIFINNKRNQKIELYQGDLTLLHSNEVTDLLVVSAFPNDYTATSTSLIGALHRKGVSVEALSLNKEIDLRENFSCWLSKEIRLGTHKIYFNRILCFEPLKRGSPPEVIADIFRALAPILVDYNIRSIIMPIVATGDQEYSIQQILNLLLDSSIHWIENGLPIDIIKIVAYSESQAKEALKFFTKKKIDYKKQFSNTELVKEKCEYDVFISYSRKDSEFIDRFIEYLIQEKPEIEIFLDRKNINIGTSWQPEIFESLDKCSKVVSVFSPFYLESKVCKEEFNISWVRGRNSDEEILFPVLLFSTKLPTYMQYKGYIDCREGDEKKIAEAAKILVDLLDCKK